MGTKQQDTKHTPTPWKLKCGLHGKPNGLTIWEDTSPAKMIADVCTMHDESESNAAFIVRACNAHDQLVAALQSMEMALIGYTHQNDITHNALVTCRAALAAAGAA